MALNFPNNPANGDIYRALGRGWKYNSTASAWEALIRVDTAFDSDDIVEGSVNLYQNPENIQDEVNNLLQQGNNINIVYDDAANTMTISAVGSNTASDLLPDQNNVRDIGSTTLKWKDLHMAGKIYSDDKVIVESAFAQTELIGTGSINANQYSGQPASVRFVTQSNSMGSTLSVIGPGQTTNGRASFEIITYANDGTTGNIRFTKTNDVLGEFHGDLSGFDITGQKLKIGDTTDTGATSTIEGSGTITIDPAAVGDNTGTVVIAGNLQVDGTTTTINSTTLDVDDLNITIASGAADSTAANGAGITVDGASATLTYSSTGDKWVFNKAPFYNTNALLTEIVQDTTPQLGGDLDMNGNNINGGTGARISLHSNASNPAINIDGGGPNWIRFEDAGNGNTNAVNIVYRTTPNDLRIERADNNNIMAEFGGDDGHAALYFDNAMKLETSNTGITVTGNVEATQQVISTIATGTAPLSVTSTTKVSNLNADLLDGKHASDLNIEAIAFAIALG